MSLSVTDKMLMLTSYFTKGSCQDVGSKSLHDIIRLGYYRYWNLVIPCLVGNIIGIYFLSISLEKISSERVRIALPMLISQFLVYRSLIQLSSTPKQSKDKSKDASVLSTYHTVFRF